MKALVFGGTFDPPHTGHMRLLQNAIDTVQPDEVLVVPAAIPPHKAESGTPGALRLAMCACFAPLAPGLAVSDIELRRQGKSYTVDTLRQLAEERPGRAWYLALGGDMLAGFTRWRSWRQVLSLATLVVQRRDGGPDNDTAAETLRAAGGRVLFTQGAAPAVSSSGLRAMLARGEAGAFAYLPPPADEIVRERGLYGWPGGGEPA